MPPLLLLALLAAEPPRRPLTYAPAPVANPLRGLVPYAGERRDAFPHALEFDYVALSALVVGEGRYDWAALETLLNAVGGRGHQAVIRVYAEYPGRTDGVPKYLLDAGVKRHRYRDPDSDPPDNLTPDYADPRLRRALLDFIAAFGAKYDGDPRLGFVTAGLLGRWGEWHTYPRDDLFPDKAFQAEMMTAYEKAFRVTPVLLRYPAGPNDPNYAANDTRPFGYHDDSFAWATLPTGRAADDWYYLTSLRRAGALDRWKTRPIGGEIRPEAWGKVFDEPPGDKRIQDFRRCVRETHASWLMDSGMFDKKLPAARRRRAEEMVRLLGYEFHARAAAVGPVAVDKLAVSVEVENRGVAPFYADWPVEIGLIRNGKVVRSARAAGKLTGLLPGDAPRVWAESLDVAGLPPGDAVAALRVPNPLPNGPPLRFANAGQDADAPGWLTLGRVTLP